MRKSAITLLALGLASTLFAVAPASAVNLLSETFTYPNGGLVPNGGWATHSGTGTDIQVVSGAANGDMANAPDDNRSFAAQTATAKTYMCFKVTVPDPGGVPRPNYFIHLKDATTTNFFGRVFVAPQGATFSFGLSVSASTLQSQWATALNYGQSYFVVVSYDAAAGSAELWVDPGSELSPKITAAGGTVGGVISSAAMRQSNAGTGGVLFKYVVDDLGVGTTFSDACVSGPTDTKSSSWGRIKTLYR